MTTTLQKVSKLLHENNLFLVSAESCTGGWIAKVITDIPGSSAYFDRGFVTYSNQAKQEMLGISIETLDNFGAVSEEVVIEMAKGALQHSVANIAVAVSGIAGPGGGTDEKPIGMVCFGWMIENKVQHSETVHFVGDRDKVRKESVEYALKGVIAAIEASS